MTHKVVHFKQPLPATSAHNFNSIRLETPYSSINEYIWLIQHWSATKWFYTNFFFLCLYFCFFFVCLFFVCFFCWCCRPEQTVQMLMLLTTISLSACLRVWIPPSAGVILIIGLSCKFGVSHSNELQAPHLLSERRGWAGASRGREGGRRGCNWLLCYHPQESEQKPQLAFRQRGKKVLSPARRCKWYFERVWMGRIQVLTRYFFFHYRILKQEPS